MHFHGSILMLGGGAVAQCLQFLLIEKLSLDFRKITILDVRDTSQKFEPLLNRGATFVIDEITKETYDRILKKYVNENDLIIDLTYNVESADLISWCQMHNVLYINASIEWWDAEELKENNFDNSVYAQYTTQFDKAKTWKKDGPTAVVDHGMNPGLISHWTKLGLKKVTENILEKLPNSERKALLAHAYYSNNFPLMSNFSGTKVIQISERDSQITQKPKKINEFVNTWSIDAFYVEAIGPAELGWGTHEKYIPQGGEKPFYGPQNEIILSSKGMDTYIYSWVPSGQIIGMLIQHGETYSISKYLSNVEKGKVIYQPTVYYVYLPCDGALASLYEMRMHDYTLQSHIRVLNNDIIEGKDEVGVLLMGHDLHGWWSGTSLDIRDVRTIAPGQNATTLQVAAGMYAGIVWVIQNPRKGFTMPEDLPYDEILTLAKPFLGDIISKQTMWYPSKNYNNEDKWQFYNFRV